MTIKQLLQHIGITDTGYYDKNENYIIDIRDSNLYGKYFSFLENSDLEPFDDLSNITSLGDDSKMVYATENYTIELIGNFDQDKYKLIIKETN